MTSLALRWAIWRYGVAISGVAIASSAALIRSASWRAQLPRTTLYGLVSHPPLNLTNHPLGLGPPSCVEEG